MTQRESGSDDVNRDYASRLYISFFFHWIKFECEREHWGYHELSFGLLIAFNVEANLINKA